MSSSRSGLVSATKFTLLKICDIIQSELRLGNERVLIWNQKKNIEPDSGMWVRVKKIGGKVFGNSASAVNGIEQRWMHVNMLVQVDVFSRDDSALDRHDEIVMALRGQLSQATQELYAFKIGQNPVSGPTDVSEIEGPAIPYRFSMTFQVTYKAELQKNVDYYDTFQDASVTVEE